jgi:hypothetical protein
LAGYASIEGETLFLRGMKSEPNGQNMRFISHKGPVSHPEQIGREAALRLKELECPASS